jgi:hypothetical protein
VPPHEFDPASEIAKDRPDGQPYQGEENVTLSDVLAGFGWAIRHLSSAEGELAEQAPADVRDRVEKLRLKADEWLDRPLHLPDDDGSSAPE